MFGRDWRRRHPKRVQEYTRQWLKRNPEKSKALAHRKRMKALPREKERAKARYARDPELAKVKARKWYDANLKRALANAARWRDENRDAIKVACHKRRASMKKSPGAGVTRSDIQALAKKQPGCPDCNVMFSKETPYTLDHVMPIVLGGAHDKSNIELRCYLCNNKKRSRDPIDHARMLGRLV